MRKRRLGEKISSSILVLLTIFLWSGTFLMAQETAGTIDGKVFVGEFGKKGQGTEDRDTFVFKDGKFRSTACDAYGFKEGDYTARVSGAAISFEAKTTSPKEGEIQWAGAVKGEIIEGSFTWYKQGKPPREYWIKGQLKD